MLSNLIIVLPIFALVLTGYAARRFGALGPTATREVNRFVVYLALPAMLFSIMAKADLEEIWQALGTSDKEIAVIRGTHHGQPLEPGEPSGQALAGEAIRDFLAGRLTT